MTWEEATSGTLYSWVTVYHAPLECFRNEVPYVVAVVDFGGGAKVPTRLVGADELWAGMPVEPQFHNVNGQLLPYFTPTGVLAE
jgi:hypothetical protein